MSESTNIRQALCLYGHEDAADLILKQEQRIAELEAVVNHPIIRNAAIAMRLITGRSDVKN